MRRRAAVAIAFAGVLAAREASGDIYHLKSPSQVETQKGNKLSLPPGYFLDEKTWQERDAALKKAQEDSTRFKAENESLRKSVGEGVSTTSAVLLVALGAFFGYVTYHAAQ
jgi:hypothetical protein